uniref:Craniofacial development protein 2 n=1 Tax=Cacopsylla melanoneura TaxID=428564 RepID=A0A8D8TNG9_9HEMI
MWGCTLGQQPTTTKNTVTNRQRLASEPGLSHNDNCPRNYLNDHDFRIRNKSLRFGTWNVRTMAIPGTCDIISEELNRYNLDLVALQETRWPYEGKESTKHHQVYYSGNTEGKHQKGVAIAVKKSVDSAVIAFDAVSERICTMRLKGIFKNITIVCIYAPIEAAVDEDKDGFYETLECVMSKVPSYDVKLVLGDANAQIGREAIWKPIAGTNSLHHETNDNGTRLLSFACTGNLKVVSTMLPRKDIHKSTWVSPSGEYKNQIDHVLIDNRHRSHITNVRTIRGAECGSDHYLVLVKIRQKIAIEKRNKSNQTPPLEFSKLKDPLKAMEFKLKLSDKFSEEAERAIQEMNINEDWNSLKNIIQDCTEAVCGKMKKKEKKPWFDEECKNMINKRRELKSEWLQTQEEIDRLRYNTQNRETTRLVRQKKRGWMNELVRRAEEDRTKNNSKDFYRTIRFFKTEYKPKPYGILDKNGQMIIQQSEGLRVWKDYFQELLNGEGYTNPANNTDMPTYYNVQPLVEQPSLEEVSKAIQDLKNNKAPGQDSIFAEVLKAGGDIIAKKLHMLILEIWEKEEIPDEWKEAVVIPIFKKGNKHDCNNYRGISLLSTPYKVLSKIVMKRVEAFTDSIIEEHQSGFIKGRSTTDQIFIVKETIAKYWEFDKECFLLFVDFQKAYDSLFRLQIWQQMEKFGIPDKLIRLTKMTVEESKCKVRVNGEMSSSFDVNTGVRQGDGISPLLFNIVLEKTLRKTKLLDKGINIGASINLLAFADDIVLLAEKKEDLVILTETLLTEAKKVGLHVSCEKTKYMRIGGITQTVGNLQVGEYEFQSCKEFKYLGVTITDTVTEQTEIENRLAAANRCFWSVQKLMSSKLLSRTTKLRIYKTIIQPVLLYGSEVWTLSKVSEKKLVTFENKVLRKIYGPVCERGTWRIRKNKEIRDLFNEPDIIANIRCRRMRWTGHVLRRGGESLIKSVWEGEIAGTRRRGRPKLRWKDQIKKDMEQINILEEEAQDRTVWRGKKSSRLQMALAVSK